MPNTIQFCRASYSRGTASNMSAKDKYYVHINCEYKAPQKSVSTTVLSDGIEFRILESGVRSRNRRILTPEL
jgi:hypothetical protein